MLFAAALAVILTGAPGSRLRAQIPAAPAPAAAVPAQPAALDRAALEKKIDELLAAYAKVNDFSGTVLLASQGQPLFAKGVGYANIEWQIPNTPKTKLPHPMPIAITFFAGQGEEPTLIKIGTAYESATHHRTPPPAFGPAPAQLGRTTPSR